MQRSEAEKRKAEVAQARHPNPTIMPHIALSPAHYTKSLGRDLLVFPEMLDMFMAIECVKDSCIVFGDSKPIHFRISNFETRAQFSWGLYEKPLATASYSWLIWPPWSRTSCLSLRRVSQIMSCMKRNRHGSQQDGNLLVNLLRSRLMIAKYLQRRVRF